MPHDPGVAEQALDVLLGEARHPIEIETMESGAEVLALGEDGAPAQPRLETLEAQLLEQPAIVGDRESPFGVMVVKELGRRAAPGTPRPAIRPGDRFAHVLDSFAAIDVWCIWPSFVRPLACGSVPDIPSLPLFLESRDRLG